MMNAYWNAIKRRWFQSGYPYKPYMDRYQCIFIHIPKCAGTSVLNAFNDNGGRFHEPWRLYREVNEYKFERYFKFSIVRHPEARVLSAYKYLLNGGNQSKVDIALKNYIEQHSQNFDEFVQYVLNAGGIIQNPLLRPQTFYLCDEMYNIRVDMILKQEELELSWPSTASKLGINAKLPHFNTSSMEHTHISNKSKLLIENLYHRDFKIFGY